MSSPTAMIAEDEPLMRERLKEMSNRVGGAKAVQMRQEAIPWAYRVFFRQVGIDPDERRTPVEQIILDRLQHGLGPGTEVHRALLVGEA